MPVISVIIPTYNRPQYLQQALVSVLDQTFTDFEAIVVDDGSEERTRATVSQFDDPRIRYFHQVHSGRSNARNLGLRESRGDYFTFLDDDDRLLPHKFAVQRNYLNARTHLDLVASGIRYTNENNTVLDIYAPWLIGDEINFQDALYNTRMMTNSVLLRRTVLKAMDEWFDPDLDLCEDTDFFIRALQTGSRCGILREFVADYRLHPLNSSGTRVAFTQSYRRVLDKVFSSEDLPEEIFADRNRIFAHFHLVNACRAYAARDADRAQSHLVEAMVFHPALVEEQLVELFGRTAGFCRSNPAHYIAFVLEHLPESLSHFSNRKQDIFQFVLDDRLRREYVQNKFFPNNFTLEEIPCQPVVSQ